MKIKKAVFSVALFFLAHVAQAQQYTVNFVTNPITGGTITGAGSYTNGSSTALQIRSTLGWYVKSITFTGPPDYVDGGGHVQLNPQEQFERTLILGGLLNPNFDPTTITNFDASLYVNGDSTTTVTFALLSPTINPQPNSAAVLTGTDVTFSSGATGRKNITYQWQQNGTNISGKTEGSLTLTNVQPTNGGIYTLVASNSFGVTNSAPANLFVSSMLVFADGQPVSSPTIDVDGQVKVSFQSVFPNAHIYYTLDGTEPDFLSTEYSGAFPVSSNCVVRGIAYKSDFSQSVTSAPVSIVIHPVYYLHNFSPVGSFTLDPPNGPYRSNTLVTITAISDADWTFLEWRQGLSGTNPTQTVLMNMDKDVTALFGTTLNTTVAGTGTASVQPSFPLYPIGMTVWLSAVPGSGKYLKQWIWESGGMSIVSEKNPANLMIDSPNMTATALFAPIPSGKANLVVNSIGGGIAFANAESNLFQIGTSCVIEAHPDEGQTFIGWSGDATGMDNPLSLLMDTNKTVTAQFSANSVLGISAANGSVQLSLTGMKATYQFETSTNLSRWEPFATVPNFYGDVMLSDFSTNGPMRVYRAVRP